MNELNILNWSNECSLTPYPLISSFGYDSFIIDASFIQFDGFTPILKSITVTEQNLILEILFDKATELVTLDNSIFTSAGVSTKIYSNARYVGKLVFGSDVFSVLKHIGKKLTVNKSFLASTVISIPSDSGVFTIDSLYGDLKFLRDANIQYIVSGQDITFNAVSLPDKSDDLYLKTLNGVHPVHNGVYIKESDIIKIIPNTNSVEIAMVGSFVPDVLLKPAIIPTA